MLAARAPLALTVLLLAGCAVSSGAPYRVQTASPTNITILTDPGLRNLPAVRQAAQAHCAAFGRTAQLLTIGKLRGGQTPVAFACN